MPRACMLTFFLLLSATAALSQNAASLYGTMKDQLALPTSCNLP